MNKKGMELNFLPIYKIGIGEFSDGILIKVPEYCICKKNDKCEKYYRGLFEQGKQGMPYIKIREWNHSLIFMMININYERLYLYNITN